MLRFAIKNIKKLKESQGLSRRWVHKGVASPFLSKLVSCDGGRGRNKGKSNFVASITNIDARGVAREGGSQADGATHILKVKYTRISRETYFECPAWVVKWKWNGIESNGDGWTTHVVGVNGGWPRPIKISLLLAGTYPLLRMYYLCFKWSILFGS